MKTNIPRCAQIVFLSFIAGMNCENKPEIYRPDYTPEISVFAMISPDEKYEFVVVERTMLLNEKEYWDSERFVRPATVISDAIVEIGLDDDFVPFKFYQNVEGDREIYAPVMPENIIDGYYLDLDHRFRAQAGQTYHLRIRTPDGRIVSGVTTVPNIPKIATIQEYQQISLPSLLQMTLHWQDDLNSAAYTIAFFVHFKDETMDSLYYGYHRLDLFHDDYVLKNSISLQDIQASYLYQVKESLSDTASLQVIAIDANYYDYRRSQNSLTELAGYRLELLEGGIGVFGSLSSDSVHVILKY
jgi:hypothetical protein